MRNKLLNWDLPGLIVPPVTAFDAFGGIDEAAMHRQIDYVIDVVQPAAVCVLGVEAQEYQYLSDRGRRDLIAREVDLIAGRRPVIVGVSHASFRHSIELATYAEELGAAAIQVLIPNRPSGGKPTTKELVRYYEAIAGQSPLPIIAYHNPGPGAEIGLGAVTEIASIERVVALKESSRNMRFLGLMIEDVDHAGLAHVFATMEVLLPSLQLGASGGTMPPPGAALCKLLVDAYRAGDHATAMRVHRFLAEMPARWVDAGLVAVMKSSLRAIGLDCGAPYPPFGSLTSDDEAAIAQLWEGVESTFPGSIRPAAHAR